MVPACSHACHRECVHQYSGWEIAVLVDVVHQFDGFVTRCVLDLACMLLFPSHHETFSFYCFLLAARPYHAHCKYTGFEEKDEVAVGYCTRIVEFFSSTYLDVLETVELHVIYFFDTRWPIASGGTLIVSGEDGDTDEDTDEAEWQLTGESTHTHVTEWRDMITRCDVHGFDQVIAISQSTINAFFQSLWSSGQNHRNSDHALVKWRHEEFFNARFKPMTLRLLSNGRAIVWIHLEHGHLKVLKNRLPWSE